MGNERSVAENRIVLSDTWYALKDGKRLCPPFNPLAGILVLPALIVYFMSLRAARHLFDGIIHPLKAARRIISRVRELWNSVSHDSRHAHLVFSGLQLTIMGVVGSATAGATF